MMTTLATSRACNTGAYLVLFDGHCAFCRSQAKRLERWASNGTPIVTRDFQAPGALDDLPGLTLDDCMKAMRLVAPDGRIFAGAEAVARLLATRLIAAPFAYLYYVPGLRLLFEMLYAWVAKRRYALAKARRTVTCDGTTCSIHFE